MLHTFVHEFVELRKKYDCIINFLSRNIHAITCNEEDIFRLFKTFA
jgi:hypothetical protein